MSARLKVEEAITPPSTNIYEGKKRGRPVKRGDKDWNDHEVFILIELWSREEGLYNSKDLRYANQNARAKAIGRVIEGLRAENINANNRQIQGKLTKLRNYYGAERRKEECSKASGDTDTIYHSAWRFYKHLHFLRGTLSSRTPILCNFNEENGSLDSDAEVVCDTSNPPPLESVSNSMGEVRRDKSEAMMFRRLDDSSRRQDDPFRRQDDPCCRQDDPSRRQDDPSRHQDDASRRQDDPSRFQDDASHRLDDPYRRQDDPSRRQDYPSEKNKRGEDGLFADMVYEMLSGIPDSREKAMAKLDFQQKLIQLKYSTQL